MSNPAPLSRDDLSMLVDRFLDSFNQNDLPAVMRHFTENALYVTYDGKDYRGKSKIREAFEPQFRGEFGRIEFLLEERILDEEAGRAVITWSCRHDLEQGGELPGMAQARNLLFRGVYGRVFVWRGLDVLVFDGSLIREKRTYAQAHVPLGKGGR